MTSWAYRATPTGTSYAETVAFISGHGFLWRPLFKAARQRSRAGLPPTYSHLGAIDPRRDELFVYFADGQRTRFVGAFAFAPVRPLAHPGGAAPAVVQVPESDPLHAALAQAGYEPDSYLGVFTGFDVVPLKGGTAPPVEPTFAGQYSIGTFPATVLVGRGPAAPHVPAPAPMPVASSTSSGLCYGVDWSGAARAGDKVWVAELDPAARHVRSVARPWQGWTAQQTVDGVATWLAALTDAWVAFDFPFGIAACDRAVLLPGLPDDPRKWGAALAGSFPTVKGFRGHVRMGKLDGVNRRAADHNAPFSPLFSWLISQTYWGLRLLGQLPANVAVLPWQHRSAATTRVLETCPAVVLRALGQSNAGYKRKDPSQRAHAKALRRTLIDNVMAAANFKCDLVVRQRAIDDVEGDALDAILAALAAWRASAQNHAVIASKPKVLSEGHIYA